MSTDTKNPDGLTPAEYFSNVKRKDQEAYEQWKTTGSKRDLGVLMDQLSPVIYHEVSRASGSLPVTALSAEAKKWTWKAIQTYDPAKGTAISTHVMNYLPKVRRLNYKFQNAVRLPENLQLKFHEYNHALVMLTDELNREPTDDELARKLGWSKPQTVKFKNSLYSDHIESGSERPAEFTRFNEDAFFMEHLMSQLTEQERIIFDNVKQVSSSDLAQKLGVNLNRLNYLKSKLIDKIQTLQRQAGIY